MGDRNNPMKFGPEWIRSLSGTSMASGNNSGTTSYPSSGTNANTSAAIMANTTTKVQLAGYRYGKEEFLALFDKTVEAPRELKKHEFLYQRKGKAPTVLNNPYDGDVSRGPRDIKNNDMLYQQRRGKPPATNTFENEMRDNMRGGPPIDSISLGDRLGVRTGRGMNPNDNRVRSRMPFTRPTPNRSISWHVGSSRMPNFGGTTEEQSYAFSFWGNNNAGNTTNRNGNEPVDRNAPKTFRRRQGNNTNWRQSRDEGDEWRLPDSSRARSTQQDKWERDWGDRPGQERPQSWSANRRQWTDRNSQSCEENVPEWAVDNAELCAGASGTFDSSGAFHGYSSDDTNLPKNQDSSYPLTRSHTHDSFARSKTTEEGLDEWWASEKAKKLSPKRFDTGDLKHKKQSGNRIPEERSAAATSKSGNKEDSTLQEVSEKADLPATTNDPPEDSAVEDNFNKSLFKPKFTESKTFDNLIRSDIELEESDERGNFQSVMITPNNSLRQKHQNIVLPVNANRNRQSQRGILKILQGSSGENEHGKEETPGDKIVEEIVDMALDDQLPKLPAESGMALMNPSSASIPTGISNVVNSMPAMPNSGIQLRNTSPGLPNQSLIMNTKPSHPTSSMQAPGIQNVGITNSALNASLGLPIGTGNSAISMPIQGVPPPMLSNTGLKNPGIGVAGLPGIDGIPGFQTAGGISGLPGANMSNNSLYLRQAPSNISMSTNDIRLQNASNQGNMFSMHNLPHSTPAPYGSSIVGNIMRTSQTQPPPNPILVDHWYYEDPKKNVQGPFTSKEMYNWYRAGFFSPNLMVRRACEPHMRPLGTYGSVVPFAQIDMVMNDNAMDPGLQFGGVGLMRNSSFGQQQMVDSLWNQSYPSTDLMWMQQSMNPLNESRVNNLPMFFWDQQPPITSNSLLPEDVEKKMKTEAQILAQLRMATMNTPQNVPFMNEQSSATVTTTNKSEETPNVNVTIQQTGAAPNLEELQKLIPKENIISSNVAPINEPNLEPPQPKVEKVTKTEPPIVDNNNSKTQQVSTSQNKMIPEPKTNKQTKNESDKVPKNKENNNTKSKNKKVKEDKKEETAEAKVKDEEVSKPEQRKSEDTSQTRNKKEDKINKKEVEKEKKEWLKEGFTIVKGAEKVPNKDKKKADEAKAAEEAERKRKEEERQAAEEEKKRKQAETFKKQQEQQQLQQQRQAAESVTKKAPWSATHREGPNLAEIQRLEREKKMEQIKEQQQMMQIIAQQQAVALAREQEMNAGLGWAKKKGTNLSMPGQSLAEIQAEGRKQTAAAAANAASGHVAEETVTTQSNHVAWGNTHNGGGFWDCPSNQPAKSVEKPQESKRNDQSKSKKKNNLAIPKKELSPAAEFETWCTNALAAWSSKIDVPTFVGFLKDIESPYEVKDYVKCYLGDTRDSNDFARQFIERRSKLLRVGMVTPSDDLCSPAVAVNPRPLQSGTEYQEVKSKSKKAKKNKMLKVDSRILGFSVTAAEDRINVGDIDTV